MYHFEQLRENEYRGTSEHNIAKIVQFLTDFNQFLYQTRTMLKIIFLLFSLENEYDYFFTVKLTIHDNFYPIDVN